MKKTSQHHNIFIWAIPWGDHAGLFILFSLAIIGIPVLIYRLYEGMAITNLGSTVPWGLWVAFYIYFIGLSAGSFLLSTLIYVFGNKQLEPVGRLAVLQAFVCLVAGLIFVWIDLGRWERFWHVFAYPQFASVLAWEIWFYFFYIVLLLAEMAVLMHGDRKQQARWMKILGIIGIPIALAVHGGTGAIFALVKARPAWYTPIFPLVFIISALVSGGGLLIFLRAMILPNPHEDYDVLTTLTKITGAFLIFDLLLLFLEVFVGLYGGIPDHIKALHLMVAGPFWWVFWIVQIFLGAGVPLVMIYWRQNQTVQEKPSQEKTTKEKAVITRMGLAGALIFIGIFGVRLNIVIPALGVPLFTGYDKVIASQRMASAYMPNWIEWLSSLGIVAMAMIGLAYLLRFEKHV